MRGWKLMEQLNQAHLLGVGILIVSWKSDGSKGLSTETRAVSYTKWEVGKWGILVLTGIKKILPAYLGLNIEWGFYLSLLGRGERVEPNLWRWHGFINNSIY